MALIPGTTAEDLVEARRRFDLRDVLVHWWPQSGAVSPIPVLDGLRGVAVLLVVVYHAWYFVPGNTAHVDQNGYAHPLYYLKMGVQLFFVLSGFLLFLPYARWLFGQQSRPSTLLFYKRRALRVVPAYWTNLGILTLTIPFSAALLGSVLAHGVFLHNVFMNPTYKINSVFWTMAVEVQFYAVLPAIAWLIHLLSRRMPVAYAAMLVLGALCVVSHICAAITSGHGPLTTIRFVSTGLVDHASLPYWLSVFSAGIACSIGYTYLTRVTQLTRWRRQQQRWSIALFCGAVLLGLSIAVLPIMHRFPSKNQMYGYVFAAILFGILFGPRYLRAPFESRALRFIGLISYSLYLWHLVVLLAVEPSLSAVVTGIPLRAVVGLALEMLIGIPVACLSFQLTERPFFGARQRSHEHGPALRADAYEDAGREHESRRDWTGDVRRIVTAGQWKYHPFRRTVDAWIRAREGQATGHHSPRGLYFRATRQTDDPAASAQHGGRN